LLSLTEVVQVFFSSKGRRPGERPWPWVQRGAREKVVSVVESKGCGEMV